MKSLESDGRRPFARALCHVIPSTTQYSTARRGASRRKHKPRLDKIHDAYSPTCPQWLTKSYTLPADMSSPGVVSVPGGSDRGCRFPAPSLSGQALLIAQHPEVPSCFSSSRVVLVEHKTNPNPKRNDICFGAVADQCEDRRDQGAAQRTPRQA